MANRLLLKVGYYLPQSGDFDDHKIQRALSYAKSDWVIVDRRPPEILDQHNYNQKFTNFDGAEPILVQYDHSVTVTKGIDYSQTKAFDVNVNANLPVCTAGLFLVPICLPSSDRSERRDGGL